MLTLKPIARSTHLQNEPAQVRVLGEIADVLVHIGGIDGDFAAAAVRRLETDTSCPSLKIKKLKGKRGQRRPEVWPYRVRYDIVGEEVVLYRVRHRREISPGGRQRQWLLAFIE